MATITTITTTNTITYFRRNYFCALGTGLYEIDKLIEEAKILQDRVSSNSTGTRRRIAIDGDTEDRISGLPSDILQFIISLLKMREGAATCILSTRWRNLWNTSCSRLKFDDLNLLGYKYPPANFRGKLEESVMTKFIKRANHICQFRPRDLKLDVLQLAYAMGPKSAGDIHKLMEFAAAQGVNKLILDLTNCGDDKCIFPVQIFGSSLNHLNLNSCALSFPPDFHGLNSLVTLTLSDCFVTANDVQNVVSNTPLQWLSLMGCFFPDSAAVFKFTGPSVQLKHLYIGANYKNNIEKVEVQDLNLLSFEVDVYNLKVSIKDVPHLTRLVLHSDCSLEIPDNLPCLETLFFNHEESELPKLSAFKNLKRLVFTVDSIKSNLFEVVCFLEACPLLQQLQLDMRRHAEPEYEELYGDFEGLSSKFGSRVGCSHHNLKEVHLYGFDSHPEIIELAKYLLENATVLEKMIMYPKTKTYKGNGIYYLSKESVRLVGMPVENVCNMLREKARPATEIIIM